ncbi:hypothetical protein [uncultured Sulfitobacter sp.]|uniref:hypothetical protein n=1 Tax=uncultured Sulfitobacter sp. TaxID=191468 RepID=UPI0009435252|nr:hypothetical protein [uncultured Sulfitobacter sp.]
MSAFIPTGVMCRPYHLTEAMPSLPSSLSQAFGKIVVRRQPDASFCRLVCFAARIFGIGRYFV